MLAVNKQTGNRYLKHQLLTPNAKLQRITE